MFDGQRIAFIGSGTMAEAMIRGLLVGNVVQADQIVAAGPRTERGEALAARHGVEATCDNAAAAEAGQVVVLAVKPQVVPVVLPELRGHLRRQDLLLSIVAGMPIRRLADGVAHAAVVRAMPNTPAQIEQGISVWTATAEVDQLQRDRAQAVLAALGEEIYVDHEGDLDKATALSGSGPAYVFMMMEAMIDAGVHLGFSRRIARQLVFRTMAGSVAYAEQSGKHVAELRNQVTSPGGTTAAALYHLEKGGLRTVISRGLWAAFERSRSLGARED